jgi:hypothetical protein
MRLGCACRPATCSINLMRHAGKTMQTPALTIWIAGSSGCGVLCLKLIVEISSHSICEPRSNRAKPKPFSAVRPRSPCKGRHGPRRIGSPKQMFMHSAKISRSDVSGITYKQTRSPQHRAMKRSQAYQVQAVAVALGVAMPAMGFYQVRELLAALLIFSVLFGAVGMALLILCLIQEVALKGVTCLEACVAYVRAWHSGISGQPTKDHALRISRWN